MCFRNKIDKENMKKYIELYEKAEKSYDKLSFELDKIKSKVDSEHSKLAALTKAQSDLLNPCPFCGAPAELHISTQVKDAITVPCYENHYLKNTTYIYATTFYAKCTKCGIKSAEFPTKTDLIKYWNKQEA